MIKKIDNNTITDFGNSIIEKLNLIDDRSFMAGGACRDVVLNFTPSDYDFYYYSSQSLQKNAKKQLETILGIKVNSINDTKKRAGMYDSSKDIKRIYTSTIDGNLCQFIQLDAPKHHSEVMANFPLNISQAVLCNELLYTSKDFDIGVKYRVLYKTASHYNSEGYYITKIRKKFPDYPYYESKEAFALSLIDSE